MKVLVIPEDFHNDHFILKPLFERLFRSIGRPKANIQICRDPLLGGVAEALKSERISEIVEQYQGMIDIYVLCIDRDGKEGRRRRLDQLELKFGTQQQTFLAVNAWEEIETWVLAGMKLPKNWSWQAVRAEIHVKETYFDQFVNQRNLSETPGGGRKTLGEEAARRIAAIRRKCSEDFGSLAKRLEKAK